MGVRITGNATMPGRGRASRRPPFNMHGRGSKSALQLSLISTQNSLTSGLSGILERSAPVTTSSRSVSMRSSASG